MPGDVNLYQLADLALKEPEVGVVNFNCLHRLLVELIKRTASNRKPYISSLEKEGDFDEKKELVSQEVNEPYAKGDEQQNVDLQETGSLTRKIDGLLGSNKDLLSKVSNLEEEVHNMRQIPSNSKILDYLSSVASTNDDARSSPVANETESNEELGISSPKKVSKEKVSNNFMPLIWRSMKHEKKISSLEDGIEKLFSLFQDLTMELKDMKQDLASSKQDFGNKKEILTNQIEKLSSMLIDLKSQIEALSGAQQDASGILSNLKEKVSTIGSALQNIPVSSDVGKEDNFVGDKEFSGLNSSVQGLQSELDALHQKMDDLDQLRNHLEHSRAGQAAMDNQIRDLKSELKHYVKHKDIKNLVSWAALEKAFNIDGMKETIHGLQRKMETLSNMAFQKSQHSPMLSRLRSGSEYGDFLSMPIAPLSDNEEDELVTRRVISLGDQLLGNDLADAGNRETWQNAMVEDQQGSVMGKEFEYSPRKKSSFDDDKKSMSRDGMDSSRQGMESVGRIHDDMNSNEQIVLQEMAKMDSKEIISSNKSPVGVGFDTSGAENDKVSEEKHVDYSDFGPEEEISAEDSLLQKKQQSQNEDHSRESHRKSARKDIANKALIEAKSNLKETGSEYGSKDPVLRRDSSTHSCTKEDDLIDSGSQKESFTQRTESLSQDDAGQRMSNVELSGRLRDEKHNTSGSEVGEISNQYLKQDHGQKPEAFTGSGASQTRKIDEEQWSAANSLQGRQENSIFIEHKGSSSFEVGMRKDTSRNLGGGRKMGIDPIQIGSSDVALRLKTPVKVFGGMNAPIEGFDETANFPSPQLQDMFRRIIELALKQGELEERVHIISSRRQLEVPANVTDARVDIKYLESLARLAEENRLLIENLASEVRVLAKVRAEFSSSSDPPLAVDPDSHAFHNHLHELDDKIQQLSAVFGSYRISSDNLFKQNQQQADAIYTFLDELNKNKADKDDTASKQLLSAYQKAVDSKVSMNTFDQSMRLLDQGLQEALQEIESYRREETALREALDKLAMDVGGKLDSKAGESLKQYLEKKIGEIKKSRNDLAQNSDVRNAAGARKPCLVPFHCISCNRPVEFTYKGILPPIPYPLPSKKSKAPLTAFEIDQIRRNKVTSTAKETFTQASLALTDRPCGGQHTTFALTRIAKTSWWTAEEVDADPVIQREPSIIDALTGKDGHIYRGRYRPSDLHDPVSSDLEADVRITHSHDKISTKQTKNSKPNKRTKAESPVHFPSITQCPSPPPRPRISNQRTTRRLETSARSVTSEGDLRKSV